ncbi:hypothetical protein F511_38288 [Dorcoceras hygrometricum]|uniref:Uncharacterized protein n=1 Tax=Dorcoceras hygrometricum TaxID=472368 RepID=A0A2Z7B214_9LAMI|nr:hypothetical protein F511_38288 [Dorcoceras hygrometricum]
MSTSHSSTDEVLSHHEELLKQLKESRAQRDEEKKALEDEIKVSQVIQVVVVLTQLEVPQEVSLSWDKLDFFGRTRSSHDEEEEVEVLPTTVERMDVVIARFQRMNPQVFNGDDSSEDADSWLRNITGLFDRSNAIIGVVTTGFECLPPSCDELTGSEDHGPMISSVDTPCGCRREEEEVGRLDVLRRSLGQSTRSVLGKWVYLVTLAMSLFDLQDVRIAIGSIATLDLPMVVDLIGIYGLKGPYFGPGPVGPDPNPSPSLLNVDLDSLTHTNHITQTLTLKQQAPPSLLSISRRRLSSPEIVPANLDEENPSAPISSGLIVQADEGIPSLVMDLIDVVYRNLP